MSYWSQCLAYESVPATIKASKEHVARDGDSLMKGTWICLHQRETCINSYILYRQFHPRTCKCMLLPQCRECLAKEASAQEPLAPKVIIKQISHQDELIARVHNYAAVRLSPSYLQKHLLSSTPNFCICMPAKCWTPQSIALGKDWSIQLYDS